ncbi:unnamed protein product [Adineta steineri]|uniref:Uncharacterized protein n=1 Tax=Adineta steineri TaxID=433720 RepID=A0A819QRF9_9BILA|nr:unnamed protein product [Adineta steineri]CAF4035713.1 unnamed protein product [Adineta steineri]
MLARLACTRANKVTVWFQRDQNVPTKIKINSNSDIDDLKEAIFGATDKGQYQAAYKAKTLRSSARVPRNTTDDTPIVFTETGYMPPPPDSSQSNHPTNSTATMPTHPITTNQISTQSQINQKSIPRKKSQFQQFGLTVAGGNGEGQKLNQLNDPEGICIDNDNSIYIADLGNHRIVKWNYNSKIGKVIAGGNGSGNQNNQLSYPTDIIFDKENNSFIISDPGNQRVIRYFDQNQTNPQIIISNIECYGLTIDKNGYIYVSDSWKHEVRRWKMGEYNEGIVVAGGNREGNRLDQLNRPNFIFIDKDYSLYISDQNNNRVMKWKKDAKEGIIVAGGNGKGDSLKQFSGPQGVIVDHLGHIYVADFGNHRVMRWREGDKEGEVIVGRNGQGNQPNQLNCPTGLSFDNKENLYVVDSLNHRIRKYTKILT